MRSARTAREILFWATRDRRVWLLSKPPHKVQACKWNTTEGRTLQQRKTSQHNSMVELNDASSSGALGESSRNTINSVCFRWRTARASPRGGRCGEAVVAQRCAWLGGMSLVRKRHRRKHQGSERRRFPICFWRDTWCWAVHIRNMNPSAVNSAQQQR